MTAPDRTTDALASALPAGTRYPIGHGMFWNTREVAAFQSEKLAESGYVLIHPESVDEATIERLARAAWESRPHLQQWPNVNRVNRIHYRDQVEAVLAALADTAAPEPCADGHAMADDDGRCIRCRTTPRLADTSAQARHTAEMTGGVEHG